MTPSLSRPTFEALAERLAACPATLADVLRVLGGPTVQHELDVEVALDAPPFARAYVDDRNGKVNVYLELAPGPWRMADVTDDAEGWTLPPPLPTSGRRQALRRWTTPTLWLTCTVPVSGQGPIGGLQAVGPLHCQLAPR